MEFWRTSFEVGSKSLFFRSYKFIFTIQSEMQKAETKFQQKVQLISTRGRLTHKYIAGGTR
jgi:hypothetical protein